MAEIRTVTTLRSKRTEILASIMQYEKRIAQARADLSHVNACIAIFEATGEPSGINPYVDTHRVRSRRDDALVQRRARQRAKDDEGAGASRHGGEGAGYRR
jgi:hypothetical protein